MTDVLVTTAIKVDNTLCLNQRISPDSGDVEVALGNGRVERKLVKPGIGARRVLGYMEHQTPVTKLLTPPRQGNVLLTGSEDGIVYLWDMAGHDAGEKLAEMRS